MKRPNLQPNAKESLAINENCFGAFESSPSFHAFAIVSKSITAGFPAKSGDGGQVVFSRNKSCGAPQKRLNLSESQPSTSTCACALDWKRGKHSFHKPSVDLPGLSFTHLKEDVLVQLFFQSSRLSVKISSSSTSMSANETSKPSTKRQRVTSNQRELLWSVWIISFVHVFSIVSESIPAGFPAKSGDGGQVVFSRNKSCGAPQERLGLSESQPSTSTCACALDWKRGKHSFQTFAFKPSVDLPGLSFTHLKEDVLVQLFFQTSRLLIKTSSTSMFASETSKFSTKCQRVTSNQRELLWSVWIISFVHVFSIVSKSITASFPAKSGDAGQVSFREIKAVGLLKNVLTCLKVNPPQAHVHVHLTEKEGSILSKRLLSNHLWICLVWVLLT